MKILDILFWVFAGGVVLWILGVWISMLIPSRSRAASGRRAATSAGGFAETGIGTMMSHAGASSDFTSDSGGGESGGGDSGGGGDFSGGGGESGGGGSSGGW